MKCIVCKDDSDYFVIHDELWKQATSPKHRRSIVCIGCVEEKLGRKLVPSDFKDVTVNTDPEWYTRYPRLMDRLGKSM